MEKLNIDNFKLVGEAKLNNNSWNFEWLINNNYLKNSNSRIYLIIINNKIVKIGKSESKNGIRETLNMYKNGRSGSPSLRSFGIYYLILEELKLNNNVKFYCYWNNIKINLQMKYFLKYQKSEISVSIDTIEKNYCYEYKSIFKKYPKWNFKENNEKFPSYIRKLYTEQVNNRNLL